MKLLTERKNFLSHWLPVLIWCGNIFLLSSTAQPVQFAQSHYHLAIKADVTGHFTEYFILAFFLARALSSEGGVARPLILGLSIFGSTLYGISDELHQGFVVGRSMTLIDLYYDFLASIAGACFFQAAVLFLRLPLFQTQTTFSHPNHP